MSDEVIDLRVEGVRSGLVVTDGSLRIYNQLAKSDHVHDLTDVLDVTYRPPGIGRGWLHIRARGGTAAPVSAYRAVQDPYAVVIHGKAVASAEQAADALRSFLAEHPPVDVDNPAHELSRALLDRLGRKARRLVETHVDPGEVVHFAIGGIQDQWIVALGERCLVVKPGFMAGATGGGRVTSFLYEEITGVEVNTGWTMGVIELLSPSFAGTRTRDYWGTGEDSAHAASNCIPVSKAIVNASTAELDRLRQLAREARRPEAAPESAAPSTDLVAQLRELGELHAAGVLSDEEFALAKQRLLS